MAEEVLEEIIAGLQTLIVESPILDILNNYFEDIQNFLDAVSSTINYKE